MSSKEEVGTYFWNCKKKLCETLKFKIGLKDDMIFTGETLTYVKTNISKGKERKRLSSEYFILAGE